MILQTHLGYVDAANTAPLGSAWVSAAVAVTAAGGLILAVVFAEEAVGRETEADIYLDAESSSSGVTLREWAGLMVRLGGASALNLDGGFSTSIHIALGEERLDVHPHGATINAVIAR